MWISPSIFGTAHNIRRCLYSDINRHLDSIKPTEADAPALKFRMELCIGANMAFCVDGTNCFLYARKNRPCEAELYIFHNSESPVYPIALLSTILLDIDKQVTRLACPTMSIAQLLNMKSLLLGGSLKNYVGTNRSATINCNYLRGKFLSRLSPST